MSEYHEDRLFALLVLVQQYERADAAGRKRIFDQYLARRAQINNWDLVGTSAEQIVGSHLEDGAKELLFQLAEGARVWGRRMAMMATFGYIKQGRSTFSSRGRAPRCRRGRFGPEGRRMDAACEMGKRDRAAAERF